MLTDAPDGVPKLREMILQLAVQGKLVPRNPDDEPASVLPEKIEAEKERLVKEKKIKLSAPPHLPVTPCKNTVFALLRKRFDLLRLENIIREIKIFKFLSDIYRNRRKNHSIKTNITAGPVNMKTEKDCLKAENSEKYDFLQ
jgi:hypothetical protein